VGYKYIAVFDGFGSNLYCLNLLTLQIIFQHHINILKKIVAAHRFAFVFFDLQELIR